GEQRIVFTIIGDGEEKTKIQKYVKNKNLEQHVKFLPFIPSDMVREYMDAADAFVIGSNFYEGWGAVVNEAMSSCCVPVVSHSVGSAAYLISNGANGLIYPLGNIKALEKCLRTLIEKDDVRASMALSAYKTVTELWCAPVAVNRFVKLCSGILSGECCGVQYETGPISRAEIIKNNWIDK
ncbi:MAG: glycosyltransferase family 4 protein, partial [Clostridia bacterium]|nr:glycosyltransferase family 4 protein [Clostridia bacterium]